MENKNWKQALEQVKGFNELKETVSKEQIKEDAELDEVEQLLKTAFEELAEEESQEETLEQKRDRLTEELRLVEEELTTSKESVEKTIEKLTERNMLGRLAKSLRLNENGKQKMFDYFENGEIK
jgi:predicted transcriptional regulator|tara:strand:- start:347 stop:718 length:372 start_codon:yes stop_codon:yes gene_type:complete